MMFTRSSRKFYGTSRNFTKLYGTSQKWYLTELELRGTSDGRRDGSPNVVDGRRDGEGEALVAAAKVKLWPPPRRGGGLRCAVAAATVAAAATDVVQLGSKTC